MPQHITLDQRKAFALRLAHLEVAETHGLQRDNVDGDQRWEVAATCLDTLAAGQLRPNQSKERLDYFLDRTLTAVPVLKRADGDIDDAVDMALADLRNRRGKLNCDSCAAAAGLRPCCGDFLDDHEIVSRAGACISRIKDTFRKVLGLAASHYSRAAAVEPGEVELTTKFSNAEPIGVEVLAFGGHHSYRDGDTPAATVEVSIDILSFDQASLDELPYVIAHEIFCHVFQNIRGAPRQACAKYDILAEGWMDFVAAEMLAGGPDATDHGPFEDLAVASAGRRIHAARQSRRSAKTRFPRAGHVSLGREAGDAVLSLFRRHDADPDAQHSTSAWDDFRDLSLQLNAAAWSSEKRTVALAGLSGRLRAAGEQKKGGNAAEARIDTNRDLVDALLRWRLEAQGRTGCCGVASRNLLGHLSHNPKFAI